MIFVTHDLRVALRVSDRIAVMQAGKIVELADAATIFAAPHHPYTRALFAAVPGIGRDYTEPVLL
jgi:peptide/nickel transport system ATP-binding protein